MHRISRALCCICRAERRRLLGGRSRARQAEHHHRQRRRRAVRDTGGRHSLCRCGPRHEAQRALRRRDHSAIRPRRLAGEAAEDRCGRRGLFRPAAAHRAEAAGGRDRRRAAAIRSRCVPTRRHVRPGRARGRYRNTRTGGKAGSLQGLNQAPINSEKAARKASFCSSNGACPAAGSTTSFAPGISAR